MSLRRYFVWSLVVTAILAAGIIVYARFVRIPQNVAYVSEEDGGISVINLRTLRVVKRVHPKDVAPRGIGITFDGKYVVTADKDTGDAAVFDTRGLRLVRRIPVGDNPEFVKFGPGGDRIFISYEPGSTAGPPKEGSAGEEADDESEPPAQIKEFSAQTWSQAGNFVAGKETEGLEFSRDGKLLIVANEAQNTLGVYEIASGARIKEINLASYGKRPRGVKISPQGNLFAVTMEGSGTLLSLDQDFNVVHSAATAAKPYGVAFDRDGSRILVAAAAAQKLQVFAADSLQLLGEANIGKRCWHFTFTPDDSKILLACGRSNSVHVLDAKTYQPIRVLEGFQLPWGIVTYPPAYGSLGLP
ncbi:MAG TPA: beta-propeller fold lactonase family protein [Candidatus Acidoferrales bacterium]|nr:beta-propeller fold lactonase family protein [Candidatus Acidoferrales bacterium]